MGSEEPLHQSGQLQVGTESAVKGTRSVKTKSAHIALPVAHGEETETDGGMMPSRQCMLLLILTVPLLSSFTFSRTDPTQDRSRTLPFACQTRAALM